MIYGFALAFCVKGVSLLPRIWARCCSSQRTWLCLHLVRFVGFVRAWLCCQRKVKIGRRRRGLSGLDVIGRSKPKDLLQRFVCVAVRICLKPHFRSCGQFPTLQEHPLHTYRLYQSADIEFRACILEPFASHAYDIQQGTRLQCAISSNSDPIRTSPQYHIATIQSVVVDKFGARG